MASLRWFLLALLTSALALAACESSSPMDDADSGPGVLDSGTPDPLRAGVLYDDCGPADGPAVRGFIVTETVACDGSRTNESTPRLELYGVGDGPRWNLSDGFTAVSWCTEEGCEQATAGSFEMDPPMGSMTTLRVELTFPTAGIMGGTFVVTLCEDDVLCG